MNTKQFAMPAINDMGAIFVASGKGGVGKSVLMENLALLFNSFYKALLMDADFNADSIEANFKLGLSRQDMAVMNSFLNGRNIDFAQTVHQYTYTDAVGRQCSLPIIPGSIDTVMSTKRMGDYLRGIQQLKRQVLLIDGGAGTDNPGFSFNASADINLLVVDDDIMAVDDAASVIETMYQGYQSLPSATGLLRVPRIRLVCNKIADPAQVEFIVQRLNMKLAARNLSALRFGQGGAPVYVLPYLPQLKTYAQSSQKLVVLDPTFNRPQDGAQNPAAPFARIFLSTARELAEIKTRRPIASFLNLFRMYVPKKVTTIEDMMSIENVQILNELRRIPEVQALIRSGKVELINSTKGGVGKTTLVANKAELYAQDDKRVLIVDNSRQQNAGYTHYAALFGNESSLLRMPGALEAAAPLMLTEAVELLFYKQEPDLTPAHFLRKMMRRLLTLATQYDHIIIDGASGLLPRNLLLNLLFEQVTLLTDVTDPESRDKTHQYTQRLDELAQGMILENPQQLKVTHVFTQFDAQTYSKEQIAANLVAVHYPAASLTVQPKLLLLPYTPVIRQGLSCQQQSLATPRIIATDIHDQSRYVSALRNFMGVHEKK